MQAEPGDNRIIYEVRSGKAYITINRPEKRNALTFVMLDTIIERVRQAEDDDDVRVIVIRAVGDHFCGGQDLYEVAARVTPAEGSTRRPSQRARLKADRHHVQLFEKLFYSEKPILTLGKGYCIGAGLHLIEASDLAIVDNTAKLGHTEQKVGLCGAAYMVTLDILTMGPKKAREMLLLADVMTGDQAAALGMVNKVVSPDALEAAGEEWADRIVRLPRDGIAIGRMATHLAMDSLGMTTQFIHGYVTHTVGTHIRYEADEYNHFREQRNKGARTASKEREAFFSVPKIPLAD